MPTDIVPISADRKAEELQRAFNAFNKVSE
ncbi:MAG: hypothetical protein H6R18_2843, partial [Proteobacteria bacterium]|nr:hypothetical protein [Pseudomonadota bacterium]